MKKIFSTFAASLMAISTLTAVSASAGKDPDPKTMGYTGEWRYYWE